ncbi:hypothetical protein [Nostoc sp. CHAB 5836]|nr:hypothetical protein [Nostoc sp. CHAB 5836]
MYSKLGDRFSQKLSGHTSTDNLSQLTIEISHRRTPPVLTRNSPNGTEAT